MKDKIVHIQIRIEKDLREQFQKKCKQEDLTVSQVLRKKIVEFIECKNGQK